MSAVRDDEGGRNGDSVERRADLDNLKVVLTIAVIVAHAAMTYGALGSWIYEEPSLSRPVELGLSIAIALGAMFGLGLFYMVAGTLTPGPLARRGSTAMLLNRVVRLGLPLVIYVLVVWPVLQWAIERTTGRATSLWAFLRKEFLSDAVWSRGSGPLWFVAVLLLLTVGWVLWRLAHPRPTGRDDDQLAHLYLVGAAALIAVGSFLVRLAFPVDSHQLLDLHVWLWPQCSVMFIFGAVGAERGWFDHLPTTMRRGCVWAAILAILGLGVILPLGEDQSAFAGGWRWEALALALVEGTLAVTMSLLVLDWYRRRRNRYGTIGRCLARSSYGAFLLQGPVLVGLALAFRLLPISADLRFVALAVTAVVASFAVAHLVHRRSEPNHLEPDARSRWADDPDRGRVTDPASS